MRVTWLRAIVAMVLAFISVPTVAVLDATPGSAAPLLGSNQQGAYDWFVGQGLPAAAAAGLVGNLDYESNGVNPDASQCGSNEEAPPQSYCGVGIAQWTWGQNSQSYRWEDLVGLARIEGDNTIGFGTTDPNSFPSLSVQEQFVWQELHTTDQATLGQIEGCATRQPISAAIQCATYAVQSGYEVPQNSTDENPNPGCVTPPGFCDRNADAEAIFQAYATPFTPSGLTVRGASSSAVTLSWQSSVASTGYEILRDGVVIGSTAGTTYTDTRVAPGTQYSYAVEGTNSNGVSTPSPAVAALTVPAQPSLSASASTLDALGGAVTVTAAAAGASSYNYAYASSPGARPIGTWKPGDVWTDAGSKAVLVIPPNTSTRPETYAIWASATNSAGTSAATPWIGVKVGGRRPSRAVARPAKASRSAVDDASRRSSGSSVFGVQLAGGRWQWGQSSGSPPIRRA